MTAKHDPLRRRDLQRMTPLELDIQALVDRVEKMGADARLTTCVIRLGDAREALADFVDRVERRGDWRDWSN